MRFSRRRALAAAVFAPIAAKLPNSKHAAATPVLNAVRTGVRYMTPLNSYDVYKQSFRVTHIDVDNGTITMTTDAPVTGAHLDPDDWTFSV